MNSESPVVKIVGVHKEAVRVSPDKENLWVVPFKLSASPDKAWENNFCELHQRDDNAVKRNARIVNDILEVEVLETDDLQEILGVVKAEIDEVNTLCEADYQKKLKIRRDVEELRQKQINVTQKIKGEIDKLNFE